MINLFRNIRKNLLNEGKTSKYFKYAIGEIVLVVIGILIALQINTWNEQKKLKAKEVEHIQNIKKNIETNVKLLNQYIAFHDNAINSNKIICDIIKTDKEYNDSLSYHFHMALIFPESKLSYAGYESLKSLGFDIIKNKELRNAIIDLFEVTYSVMRENLSVTENEINIATVPFRIEYFEMVNVGEGIIPNDFENLKDSQIFKNQLSLFNNINHWGIYLKTNCLQESNLLIELLTKELEKHL